MPRKLMFIFGTRPEVIKLAPVILEAKDRGIKTVCISTGQHLSMFDMMVDAFNLDVEYSAQLKRESNTLPELTSELCRNLDYAFYSDTKPDIVFVQGDTLSTFIGSLVGFYYGCKVAHVEAGLRSHNKWSPFPEEMMRVLTSKIADYHFCPTELSKKNLLDDGIDGRKCYVTGNTVIDAMRHVVYPSYVFKTQKIRNIVSEKDKFIVLTMHRRENIGSYMESVLERIKDVAEKNNIDVIFPVHLNPLVQTIAENVFKDSKRVHLVPPLDYIEFANLLSRCLFVLTDSGGIQEEAPYYGKPVVVLRKETERPEAVHAGAAVIAGVDPNSVQYYMDNLLNNPEVYRKMSQVTSPYGDGYSAQRIINILEQGGV